MNSSLETYRFQLDKSSKKFRCPSCEKKRFVKYTDTTTGGYLPVQYGRCDREINCGYHFSPYQDGFKNSDWRNLPPPQERPPDFINPELFKASLKAYGKNNFVGYLKSIFPGQTIQQIIKKYYIGTSKYWPGATVFWQVDENRKIRTGKIMLYSDDGHRKKSAGYNYITWVHAVNEDKDFNLNQCLFGAHLVPDSDKLIAVVESEKTACICDVYFPQYLWLATGAMGNLKPSTCNTLSGREVTLFPDVGAFDKWQQKAIKLAGICDVSVSNYLQTVADPEAVKKGYDLADYLIGFNPDKFKAGYPIHKQDKPLEAKFESQKNGIPPVKLNSAGYPADWDKISIDPGTQEAAEAKRHALNDCDTEFERLKILDPKVALIAELFDGEPITEIELS